MSDLETRIKDRIAQLIAERDDYVVRANMNIAAYNGAIEALEGLLFTTEEEE